MAEKSLCDGAMLKEPLLLDFSPYHEISGTKRSTCTMGHMYYGELISLIFNIFEILLANIFYVQALLEYW